MTSEGAGSVALEGTPEVLARLEAHGIRTVADALDRATCIRDLPERSNHVLRLGDLVVHLKRSRRAGAPREAAGIRAAAGAGVPTAALVLYAEDPRHGSLTGTLALDPAEPLDDLLRAGRLSRLQRNDALRRLALGVAALHQAHLHHRDLYCNHVFAQPRGTACPVALIDLERVGTHRRAFGRRVVKDLAALFASLPDATVPVRERARFLLRYLAARGVGRRPVYDWLVRRIRRKARRIRAHVPRTPVGEAARPAEPSA